MAPRPGPRLTNDGEQGSSYGENIAEGFASATDLVDAWGNEVALYSYPDAAFSEATGHFTQLVWKVTNQVGCGRAFCSNGWLVFCEYMPWGNVAGAFHEQVGHKVEPAEADAGGGSSPSTEGDGSSAFTSEVGRVLRREVHNSVTHMVSVTVVAE